MYNHKNAFAHKTPFENINQVNLSDMCSFPSGFDRI